jgi:hypothetical protein
VPQHDDLVRTVEHLDTVGLAKHAFAEAPFKPLASSSYMEPPGFIRGQRNSARGIGESGSSDPGIGPV